MTVSWVRRDNRQTNHHHQVLWSSRRWSSSSRGDTIIPMDRDKCAHCAAGRHWRQNCFGSYCLLGKLGKMFRSVLSGFFGRWSVLGWGGVGLNWLGCFGLMVFVRWMIIIDRFRDDDFKICYEYCIIINLKDKIVFIHKKVNIYFKHMLKKFSWNLNVI